MFFERFCQPPFFFCCSIYIETAQNFREECNEFAELSFFRLSLCLSRDSLSYDTRSLDLCILFKFIVSYLSFFCPILARFSHVLLCTNFFLMYSTMQNIFLIPDDAVVRNLIIIFIFSSQRPHLNYVFLSNVYSFDTMEFSMKDKC